MSNRGYTSETAPPALRDAYRWLEPDPNADYGTLLPFARDRATGERRWGMPGMVRDFPTGSLDLMAGVDTGEVTPRAALPRGQVEGQNILPLFFRADRRRQARIEPPNARDPLLDAGIAGTVLDAFDAGHDAVRIMDYPDQLRSWFAAFDPAKRNSPDLMAGFAVPGPAPLPGVNVTPPAEPGLRVPMKAGRSAAKMEF